MARRHSGFRQRVIASGRKTFWFAGVEARDTLASASSVAISISLNAAALSLRPFTIIRTRGFVGVRSDQTAASEDQNWAIGSIVVSDEAVAVGVSAVPTPDAQSASPWFMYERGAERFLFISGVGVDPRMMSTNVVIDSKAMRKVEEGQDVISVVEASALSDGIVITSFFKYLIKLH